MGVIADAVYLFDEKKNMIRPIVWALYELIHAEATYTLSAEIDMGAGVRPGQHIGFSGIDDRFLLFEIDEAEDDASRGVTMITATDAAVAELAHKVVREARMTGDGAATARRAADVILQGSNFSVNIDETTGEKKADLSLYYEKRWKRLKELEATYGIRVVPYYTFAGNGISSRRVDLLKRENRSTGMIYERENGTAKIYVTYSGAPVTRMYGIGKATGTEDPPSCVTFNDVVWRKNAGDPADKPAGQTYVEDAEALALYGGGREDVFNDKNETDPEKLLESTWEALQKRIKPKVSGSASASDVEHMPGMEHRKVRLYDAVTVRTKRGQEVTAAVIDVKRDYLRPYNTKITIGEDNPEEAAKTDLIKTVAQTKETSTRNSRSSGAASNRYIETKQLIQLNAETIQANARLIETNADEIKVNARDITINAGRIQVNAELIATKVSADEVKAMIASFLSGYSGKFVVHDFWAAKYFHFQGYEIEREEMDVMTGGTWALGGSIPKTVVDDNGNAIGSVYVPTRVDVTPTRRTIKYLNW